jgi:hypothetical protein
MLDDGSGGGLKGHALVKEFLGSIFGDVTRAWTTGFADFASPWWDGAHGAGHLERMPPDGANYYFVVSELDPKATRRANANVRRQVMVVADDVGTKADLAAWECRIALGCPEPTFRIETNSVGGVSNQTWGWVLDAPVDADDTDGWMDLARLRAWWGVLKMTDEGVADPAHYIRLPLGWNSKPKYLVGGAAPSPVRLLSWHRGHVVGVEELARATIGDDWRTRALPPKALPSGSVRLGALTRTADMNRPEPIIRLAQVLGLNPVQTRAGVVEASCPNWTAHTQDGREHTGFAFLGGGMMHCNHASCAGLSVPDYRRMMIEQYDQMQAGLRAAGLVDPTAPIDGDHFLARGELEDRGLLEPDAVAEAIREADALAARMSEAAGNAALLGGGGGGGGGKSRQRRDTGDEVAAGITQDDLFRRFVYVTDLDCIFDCARLVLVPTRAFEKMREARALAECGIGGRDGALGKFFNDPRQVQVECVVSRPGDARAVVEMVDDHGKPLMGVTGAPRLAANRWVRSRVGVSPDMPKFWLDAVGYVLPGQEFRDWWLNWIAWHIQNPGLRTPTIPVIHGAQGIGKDMILTPLRAIIGEQNCTSINSKDLVGSFNEWATARFLVLTEFALQPDGADYARLKALTGTAKGTKVKVNEKYVQPYMIDFVGFFMAMTNDAQALRGLDKDDRRFAVYQSPAEPHPDPAWYSAMFTGLASEGELARVHGFLLNRDLSKFDPHAPAPDVDGAKADMIGMGQNVVVQQVIHEMTAGAFAGRRVVSFGEVHRFMQNHALQRVRQGVNWNNVRTGLVMADCKPLHAGRLVSVGGGKGRLWAAPGMTEAERTDAARNWSPGDAAERFKDDWLATDEGRLLATMGGKIEFPV